MLPVSSHVTPAGPVARTGAAGSFGRLAARFAAAALPVSSHVTPAGVAGPDRRSGKLRPPCRSVRSSCAPGLLPRHTRRSGGPDRRNGCYRPPCRSVRGGCVSGYLPRHTCRRCRPGRAYRVLPAVLPLGSRRLCFRISPTSHLPALPARAGVSGATGRLTARFAAAVLPVSSHVTPAGVAGPAKKRCFSFADVIYIILMENQTWRCDEKESTGFDSPGREWRPPAVSRQRVQTGKFTLEHLG